MLRFVLSIGLVAAVVAGVLALPIDVPYDVTGNGLVMPAREWLVVRDTDGSIGSQLRDHVEGTVRSANVHRFERGDAVRYQLETLVGARAVVSQGDTILSIFSNETDRQLAALGGQVAAAESAVALHAAGEKEPLVRRAERNLARVLEEVELARSEVRRLRPLGERQLVAEREVEAAETRLQVLEEEAAIARAELEAVTTGAKDEQVELARREVAARRSELDAVAERRNMQTLRAPFSGVIVRSFGADTLLTVRDTSTAVVTVPIAWDDSYYLRPGQPVHIEMQEIPVSASGRLVRLDDTVRRLQGNQVVMAVVMIDDPPPETIVGGVAHCTIRTAPVSLLEYVRRTVR